MGTKRNDGAFALWDVDNWAGLSSHQVELARTSGALAPLVLALNFHAVNNTFRGNFEVATSLVAEQHAVKEVTGVRMASYGAQMLAAYQGRPADLAAHTTEIEDELIERGDGYSLEVASWATALLNNGLGRYTEALTAAQEMAYTISFVAPFALAELIEAAVRTGQTELALDALPLLSAQIVTGSDWAAGIEARAHALLSVGEDPEHWYSESIAHFARTPLRPELARAHLLYGEWLRRENRRVDAREQLRAAHEAFVDLGAEAFAERARRELVATGERARKRDPGTRNEGLGVDLARWTAAILNNGVSRYEEALAMASPASSEIPGLYISAWMLPERIEAAVRCGQRDIATTALHELMQSENPTVSDWGLGVAARSRAMLEVGTDAEDLYHEAIDHLSRTRIRTELARAHLVYGEWLRRENRRVDAREQLRIALDMFLTMQADGFGERTRRELAATGEHIRKRGDDTRTRLTDHEDHIARLARDGRTNAEIAAELFISARTVEWHLRKVFTKLDIRSRRELKDALPSRLQSAQSS